MSRGNDTAQDASKQGLSNATTFGSNAQGLYSVLAPALMGDIAHPPGISPDTLAKMNTAAQQSAGGSQAAAVGQGRLLAGRTRNPGSADAAIASAARSTGESLSDAALKTELANEQVKEHQRSQALGEAGGVYGTGVSGSNAGLGEVANNVNANTNAEDSSWSWARYLLDPALSAAGEGASAFARRR